MAETNGGGRMDRIEATLAELAKRNQEFAVIQEQDREERHRESPLIPDLGKY